MALFRLWIMRYCMPRRSYSNGPKGRNSNSFRGLVNVPEVEIKWLREKCGKPQACGKCLEVCPHVVFVMFAVDREPRKISEKYEVVPSFDNFCTLCNLCVENCPNDALVIKIK